MALTERYLTSIDNVEDDGMRGRVPPLRDDEWVLRTKLRRFPDIIFVKHAKKSANIDLLDVLGLQLGRGLPDLMLRTQSQDRPKTRDAEKTQPSTRGVAGGNNEYGNFT